MSRSFLAQLPASCEVLRDYQRAMLRELAAALARGMRRVLLQAPTGSGKTHLIAATTAAAVDARLRVVILVTRTRLAWQVSERLAGFGVLHGVIAASLPGLTHLGRQVQVASVDTLYRRSLVSGRAPLPPADVVIFDEAHLAAGESRVRLLDAWPDAVRIGFTATPALTSGRALGDVFDVLVRGPSVQALIGAGALVRPRIFTAASVTEAELARVAKDGKTGDFAAGELGALMSRPKLVGDVVANWLRIAAGRRTLVFACGKAHGAHLVDAFRRAGVAAELVTDQTPESEREAAIGRLERGETTVLCSAFLLSYGIDIPSVSAIVLARPTRSVVLYLQAIGRGMRPAAGKDSVLVLDHGRVVETLGLPTADFGWSLSATGNVNARAREYATQRRGVERPRTCGDCGALWLVREQGTACPECGWMPTPAARAVETLEGELHELGMGQSGGAAPDWPSVERFTIEALGFYRARWPDRWQQAPRKARAWAWHSSRRRHGLPDSTPMPTWFWNLQPAEPSAAVAGWLKAELIAWAKRRPAA